MRAKYPERAERLREFLNRLNIKNITLASKLGIKPAFVSQLLNKYSTVTTDVALRISRVYPTLNIHWLLDGEGEMFLGKKEAESLPSVVQEATPVYERLGVSAGGGLLEALVGRVVALEDRLAELEEEVRRLRVGNKKAREHFASGLYVAKSKSRVSWQGTRNPAGRMRCRMLLLVW